MDESPPDGDENAVSEAVAGCLEAVTKFQSALETLSDVTLKGLPDERTLAVFARSWLAVSKQHQRVETLFDDLTEIVQDVFDSVEAETALKEPGDSVPWEQVKAELGLP